MNARAEFMPLERRAGWEARLAQAVADVQAKPYAIGEHDCFRFACAVVEALTGVDLWREWAGRYKTERQALRLIAIYGGCFTPAATKLFGVAPSSIKFARRGDIAEIHDETGNQHLAVVLGADLCCPHKDGLRFYPREAAQHVWKIG